MNEDTKYTRWAVSENDLQDMTPEKARDLIVQCFFEAQKETFVRTKQKMGTATDDDEIRKSVVNVVKMAFKLAGGDFDRPAGCSLGQVVESLAKMSQGWGTPPDIIEHHRGQIMKILGRLL